MSYEPLHHKYRPQTLADLVGQEAIAQTLSNALTSRKIAPAYLFTGPRGTGKTSSARIFAKSLNCLKSSQPTPKPCGECEVCRSIARGSALDVIEIDAASNTGVDNIREIIERAQFAPVQCRYKVYAIDECHMLSTAAFNALLKTLEEPPDRVVFILATTDPQRVLPTIISRCQRFDYRRIPLEAMISHLDYIARQEKIDITDEAIAIIAQLANGGLRDAESLLDQLSLFSETIVPAKVWDLIGNVPEDDLLTLIGAIRSDNSDAVIQRCRQILDRGKEPLIVLQNLANFYLNLLIAKTSPNRSDLVAVTSATWQALIREASQWQIELILQRQKQLKDSEVQLKNTTQPRLWLEITLLSLLPSANRVATINSNNINQKDSYIRNSNDKIHTSVISTVPQQEKEISSKNKNLDSRDRYPAVNESPTNAPDNKTIEKVETIADREPIYHSKKIDSEPVQKIATIEEEKEEPKQEIKQEEDKENEPEPKENSLPKIDLDVIWKKAIDVVVPPTTKELLRQQCFLMSFDGTIAKIGIGSPQLMKLHQGKLANIEAAFSRICDRKVKAVFEVAKLSQSKEKKTSSQERNTSAKTTEDKANYTHKPKENKEVIDRNTNLSQPQTPNTFIPKQPEKLPINTNYPASKIPDSQGSDKVVDIQSYRKENRELERVLPQIREANGSNLPTKQPISEIISTKPTPAPEKTDYNSILETKTVDLNISELDINASNLKASNADNEDTNKNSENNSNSWQEVKKIAEEIASFFNGEIVNIE